MSKLRPILGAFRIRDYAFLAVRLGAKAVLPPKAMGWSWAWVLSALRCCVRGTGVECPCCGGLARRFLPYGFPLRSDALCAGCGALERHRETALYLKGIGGWMDGWMRKERCGVCLHVAPEAGLYRFLKREYSGKVVTIDFLRADVNVRCDLQRLPFSENMFELVICHQVLEHINRDKEAVAQLWQALKPRGILILSVPIGEGEGRTRASRQNQTAWERSVDFGQEDHVRRYDQGNLSELLSRQGFMVERCPIKDTLSEQEILRYGLNRRQIVWIARKAEIGLSCDDRAVKSVDIQRPCPTGNVSVDA